MTLRVIELFAGIGAQTRALTDAGIPHEVVAISEIDKFAIASYEAIHGAVNNLGDICKIEHLPECDLLTYSFPCTDLSMAGKRKGMTRGSGTRSGLLWEVERLLMDMRNRGRLPMTLVMENVNAIIFKKNISNLKLWIAALSELGYTSSYKILNASDYGTPQNRKRCYMVSILDGDLFQFPAPQPSDIRLKDVLEDDVPEKFFLSEEAVSGLILHESIDEIVKNLDLKIVSDDLTDGGIKVIGNLTQPKRSESCQRVYSPSGYSPTITTCQGGGRQPKIALIYPCLTPERYNKRQNGPRFKVAGSDMFTLTAQDRHGILIRDDTEYIIRIRHLTPRECWRLMGQSDTAFDRAASVCSDSQLYKQAGNSIVVNVLKTIFDELYNAKQTTKQPQLSAFAETSSNQQPLEVNSTYPVMEEIEANWKVE